MKATLEFNTDEPGEAREFKECSRATSMSISLWDIDQLLRNMLKYENSVHEGYLTDAEDEAVSYVREKFHEILKDNDIEFILEG